MDHTDWRLWGAFGVSVISLVWSLFNSIYTYKSAQRIRLQGIALDEFRKSIRDPIVAAIDSCMSIGVRADAIQSSAKSLEDLLPEVEQLNKDAIASLNSLSDKLNDANNSEFSSAKDWLIDFENLEDKILSSFDEALNSVHAEEKRKSALYRVKRLIVEHKALLQGKYENEIKTISRG